MIPMKMGYTWVGRIQPFLFLRFKSGQTQVKGCCQVFLFCSQAFELMTKGYLSLLNHTVQQLWALVFKVDSVSFFFFYFFDEQPGDGGAYGHAFHGGAGSFLLQRCGPGYRIL